MAFAEAVLGRAGGVGDGAAGTFVAVGNNSVELEVDAVANNFAALVCLFFVVERTSVDVAFELREAHARVGVVVVPATRHAAAVVGPNIFAFVTVVAAAVGVEVAEPAAVTAA
jgi:hypothetical protein